MSVDISIEYLGDLRCRAKHGPSGVEIITDAPVDNQGKGESFSPTDLVATALGACMMTIMGIVAKRHDIDLKGTTISVRKEMTPPPRKIASLTVEFRVPVELSEENRQRLEQAALTCPVHRSIDHEVAMPIKFNWNVAGDNQSLLVG